jgi:hypothetical protein
VKVYTAAWQSPAALPAGCLGNLWTPTRRIRLLEVRITSTGTQIPVRLRRTTARGTVTGNSAFEQLDGNDEASSVTADSLWSVQPTFAGNSLAEFFFSGTQGQMEVVWEFYSSQIWIPGGNGVGLQNNDAALTSANHEAAWLWEE